MDVYRFLGMGCATVEKSNPRSRKKVFWSWFLNPRTGFVMWVTASDAFTNFVDEMNKGFLILYGVIQNMMKTSVENPGYCIMQ